MMKLKKAAALIGSISLVLVFLVMYTAKDLSEYSSSKKAVHYEPDKWIHFENKIKQLESELSEHHNAVNEIREAMKNILDTSSKSHPMKNVASSPIPKPMITVIDMRYDSTCPFQAQHVPKTDIQMLEMYKTILFDNPKGGVWTQGWDIKVDEKDWNRQNKLNVFVVPHSHNDPGWTRTFEDYYLTQTKHILNNMLRKLPEDPRRKFIWAEISFFAMWWEDIGDAEREAVKKLLKNNQLEIVTGGWVMNDEANSHWLSTMYQLVEGHQWLQQNLNYTPLNSWSIDPFGLSLTQPALLKEMGFKNMLIQRVHYSVKKELAKHQNLEFRWKQLWDNTGKTEIFTHMMPFYSYDIPHSCGPDPKICCQFDFKRLPGHGLHCPWKVPPQAITDENVAQKAVLLLDQYRKKSKLYKSNVLLVALGDDFRYDHPTEWDVQFNNYQRLFDHMNSNLNLNVQAQFGTLNDYFQAVHKEKPDSAFPTLSGDFFTYADRDDHYFSGYYTSRPFYKRMDRVLLSYIRSTEIILTLAYLSGKPGSQWITDREVGLQKQLSDARKSLALFQHHDGITGTSKDHVVIDYGQKLLSGISACQHVIQHSAHILLNGKDAETPDKDASFYNIDDVRHSHSAIAERFQITIGSELPSKRVAIFNSLPYSRAEVVTFFVSTPYVEVLNMKGNRLKCQISPIFEYGSMMSQNKFQLSFVANIPALGLLSYTIHSVSKDELPTETAYAAIRVFNQYGDVKHPPCFTDVETSRSASEFTLQNKRVTASFSKLGLLKAIKVGINTLPIHLDFAKYGTRMKMDRSGAYLFLPDGDAMPIPIENTIVNKIDGPIMSSVTVQLPYVHHVVTLYSSPGADSVALEIENIVNIEKTSNFEIAMRFFTNIQNRNEFFTDDNAYQVMRRKRFSKLPLQANYYPMPSTAYIEDFDTRFTIVTSTPLGTSSLEEGHLEVMLDRRLDQDDSLGVGQGVQDNKPTKHTFRVLLERKTHNCETTAPEHSSGFPTVSAHVAAQTLLNPLLRLLRTEDEDDISKPAYVSVESDFGVDFIMSALRPSVALKQRDYVGLVLHRQFLDVCYADRVLLKQFPLSDGTVNLNGLLPTELGNKMFKTSLSFLTMKEEVSNRNNYSMCPMEFQAFVLQR